MALIKCPDCGKEVSDKSEVCIKCGCPLQGEVKEEKREREEKNVVQKPKKSKKNILFIALALIAVIVVIIVIVANSGIEVPYLYGVSEETATSILTGNSLIPNIVYEYDDYVEEGKVIRTNPYDGAKVSENSVVEVYVSKGPSYIPSKDSTIRWWYVDYNKEDNWEFNSPYIQEGYLYIDCQVVFGTSFTWKSDGYGTASINDTFDKSVPIDLKISNSEVSPGVEQEVTFVIPLNDLNVKKPTSLYTLLSIERNGIFEQIEVNFTISW